MGGDSGSGGEEEWEGQNEMKEKKMSRKELKKLKKKVGVVYTKITLYNPNVRYLQEEMTRRMELDGAAGNQFSVSQRETKVTEALLETTKDIKIEQFSISARGKDLLVNASLQITAGRRYGLVGPNG